MSPLSKWETLVLGNSENRTMLFESEVKLVLPKVLSQQSAFSLLKGDVGKRLAGVTEPLAPTRFVLD